MIFQLGSKAMIFRLCPFFLAQLCQFFLARQWRFSLAQLLLFCLANLKSEISNLQFPDNRCSAPAAAARPLLPAIGGFAGRRSAASDARLSAKSGTCRRECEIPG